VRLTDEQLWDLPYLHMTGHGEVKFSDAEVARLREYLVRGGFLHADDNYGLDASFRREIARVFPDRPLVEVPLSHPVYHAVYAFPRGLPKVHEHDGKPPRGYGIYVGKRLAVFYTHECDLGNGWEDVGTYPGDPPAVHEQALRMGRQPVRVRRDQPPGVAARGREHGRPPRRRPRPPRDAGALDALLAAERGRVRLALGAAAALATAAVLLAGVAAAAAALGGGRWLALPAPVPGLAWLALACAAAALALRVRPRVRADAGDERVARAVERERALRAGALRAAREVAATGPLGARAADDLARTLGAAGGPLAPSWLARARRLAAGGAVACVGALAAVAAAGAWAGDGLAALLHPVRAARGTLLPALRVEGAPARVARGRPLAVTVVAPGRARVVARWRLAGRPWTARELAPGAGGRAALALGPVDADLTLVVSDGRARTDTVRVRADQRPFLGDVAVRAEFPSYLDRAPEALPAGDVLRVPRGTALDVRARASAALARAALVGPAGRAALAPAAGGVPVAAGSGGAGLLAARLMPVASGRWTWDAADARGAPADVPPPLDVVVLPDSAPVVAIASPAADTTVDGLAPVALRVRAGDDHGLASVTLRVVVERARGGREAVPAAALAGAAGPAWEGAAEVRPQAFSLAAGDRVYVQAVAVDASPWAQAGASRTLVLRVPGAADQRPPRAAPPTRPRRARAPRPRARARCRSARATRRARATPAARAASRPATRRPSAPAASRPRSGSSRSR
jgi:hypothetical protein